MIDGSDLPIGIFNILLRNIMTWGRVYMGIEIMIKGKGGYLQERILAPKYVHLHQ